MPARTADKSPQLIRGAIREREWRRSGRSLVVATLVLLAFLGFGLVMIFAVYPGHPGDISAPTCNGVTMSPGDVCDEYTNGVVTNTYSYQDMLRMQQASHPAALVAGIVVLAIVALAVVPALGALNPAKPWGRARPERCPKCQQTSLREKKMTHSRAYGRTRVTWSGIVTLCTPDCGFSAVRKP